MKLFTVEFDAKKTTVPRIFIPPRKNGSLRTRSFASRKLKNEWTSPFYVDDHFFRGRPLFSYFFDRGRPLLTRPSAFFAASLLKMWTCIFHFFIFADTIFADVLFFFHLKIISFPKRFFHSWKYLKKRCFDKNVRMLRNHVIFFVFAVILLCLERFFIFNDFHVSPTFLESFFLVFFWHFFGIF